MENISKPFKGKVKRAKSKYRKDVRSEDKEWIVGLLISLPVLRVLLSTILFLKQKEFIMSAIGLTVLLGLMMSFSLGIEL